MTLSYRNVTPSKGVKNKKISIIVLTAGEGSRMKSYGSRSLLLLPNNITLLQYQINTLKAAIPSAEIIVVTGFEADKVMNTLNNDIIQVENEKYGETNAARSIGVGLRAATSDNVLLVHGDLIFNPEILRILFSNYSFIIMDNKTMKFSKIGCTQHNSSLEHMFFNLENKWAHIAFFTGQELELLRHVAWQKVNRNMFTFEVINRIIDKGGSFKCVTPKNAKVCDIDSPSDIEYFNKL